MRKYFTYRDLTERYGVSKMTVWRWRKVGFPQPMTLGGCNKAMWKVEDVEKWEKEQEAA